MRSKTKQRIVDTARYLFNTRRYGRVTTAILAEALEMREGNLWYHYKTKRDLLDAIQQDFIIRTQRRQAIFAEDLEPLNLYISYLLIWKEDITDFQFMYRDQADYGDHSPELRQKLPEIYEEVQSEFRTIYLGLREAGELQVADEDMDSLILNAILIIRYYLELMGEILPIEKIAELDVADGFLQHLSLFKDKMSASTIQKIKSSLELNQ